MLLDRPDQSITVTDLQRSTKAYFDKLEQHAQDHYVVVRNGKPIFIMIGIVELPGRSLLDRADEAIRASDVPRNATEIFDKLQNGGQDRYLVMRDSRPVAELLSLKAYEQRQKLLKLKNKKDGGDNVTETITT